MAKAGLLFVGADDGIVLFSDPNTIGRWFRIGHELRGYTVRSVWPLAGNPQTLFAAVDGLGLQRSDDGGQRWQQALDFDGRIVVGHAGDPQLLYVAAANGDLYRSAAAGARWSLCPRGARAPESAITSLVVAPAAARHVSIASTDGAVWSSRDGGETWARYGGDLPAPPDALAITPANPNVFHAVAGGALYRCASAETPWERAADVRASGALAVLAGAHPVILLAQAGSGLIRSADNYTLWTGVGPADSWAGDVTALAPASYHMDTIFAGTAGGQLALSTDRGRTWLMLRADLPPIRTIAPARLA